MSDISDLERDLAMARKGLDAVPPSKNARQGLENKYGQAYEALVRAGARPKLRSKYRVH